MLDLAQQTFQNRTRGGVSHVTYREILRWLTAAVLFAALVITYASNHMEILDIQYQMVELNRQNGQLKADNAALKAELNSLTNPERITQKASQMGLISANRDSVQIIQAGALLEVDPTLVAEARSKAPIRRE